MAQTAKPSNIAATSRRSFLRGGAAAAGAATLTGPLAFLKTKALASGHLCGTRGPSPYGDIFPTKDDVTGLPLIMLPRGFKYSTFSWRGDMMNDGNLVPSGHDGMAIVSAANPGGQAHGKSQTFTLIRNQEVFGVGNAPIAPDYNYDPQGGGGTTALTWQNGKLIDHHVSISGTSSNCAGGPSPWGTWITCEEGMDEGDEPHGYAFECTVARVTNPTPLKAMGRFAHEALAFDPRTGVVFLTEDNSSSSSLEPTPTDRRRGNSGFYCFVPNNPLGGVGSLAAGGALYMLKALGADDLRDPECFSEYDVEWVKIDTPDAPPSMSLSAPYIEGRGKGGTRFQRLEGCWWDATKNRVVFVDTEGGPIGSEEGRSDRAEGAVWTYDPVTKKLKNIFVSQGALAPDAYGGDNPDNCSVSPNGGIILCEDDGTNDGNGLSLLGLLPNGQTFEFARNIINIGPGDESALIAAGHNPFAVGINDYSDQEWAGATFSPDGKTLFANIQTPGITFAITGPFAKGPF